MSAENATKAPAYVSQCGYCGSTNLVRNVMVDQTADAGKIGLAYHIRFLLTRTEPLFADVCEDCGSLARIFVKHTGRKWCTK